MAVAIVESTRPVTGGIDTHLDIHVAAALDTNGGVDHAHADLPRPVH
jgi:hypothetical protein